MAKKKTTGDLIKGLEPTRLAWEDFEEEVAAVVESEVRCGGFGLYPETTTVVRKPRYFSRDRSDHIKFDISIEVRAPLKPDQPCLIWILECKNENRKVAVDEIEEFRDKLKQVGAHKGMMVSRAGFQQACIEIAKASGIGLMTLDKGRFLILKLSADTSCDFEDHIVVSYCLYTFGEEFENTELTCDDFGSIFSREGLEMK